MSPRTTAGVIAAVTAWLALGATALAALNAGTDSGVRLIEPQVSQGFTVAILADRTTGFDTGLAVLEEAVSEINLLKPAFVIHIGDFVPGYIRDTGQWEKDIERVKAILGRLEMPLFPLAGNHDVITGTGNPDDRRGEELYKRYFGPLYYSFDCRDAHFVCLYTDEALRSTPQFSKEQLDWLQQDLACTAARQVFVFVHKPVWEYPEGGWDAVHALLRRYPVRAVIAGHLHHYYKAQERDGIQYYVIGVTGGRLFSPELAGGLEHYCLLRVEPDGYRLALVKPGHVLPDDYIVDDDYKDMEQLRLLPEEETGVAAPIRSPELGEVDGQVAVFATNPLDVPLRVIVSGVARGGPWTFVPPARSLLIAPGGREYVYLGIRSPKVSPEHLVVPEAEVQYTYMDRKGRSVPIALPRRIPLAREVTLTVGRPAISLDGRADEAAWQQAPVLTTATWRASPYETGQTGPAFRILATGAGLYLSAESADAVISDFPGTPILSDALFIGALPQRQEQGTEIGEAPVVVIFPFAPAGSPTALHALWHPKEPVGTEVQGVHIATSLLPDQQGWRCEGFVPWDVLIAEGARPGDVLRFNIGAWDNDGDLFTEVHSWAPTDDPTLWGRLVLVGAAPE
jgi:hypothetical protein